MKTVRFYGAENCSTCLKAFNFLVTHRYPVERIDIFKTPPSREELIRMLELNNNNIHALFNTAGRLYKEQRLAEKIPALNREQALDLLQSDGRLIRRPFIFVDGKGLAGFDPKVWKALLV